MEHPFHVLTPTEIYFSPEHVVLVMVAVFFFTISCYWAGMQGGYHPFPHCCFQIIIHPSFPSTSSFESHTVSNIEISESLILHSVKMCHLWLIKILYKGPFIKNITAFSVSRCSMMRVYRTGEVGSSIWLTGSWDLNPLRVQGLLC